MLTKSPLTEWRENNGMRREQLAAACGIKKSDMERIEEGKEGLVGELQDYLTGQGENVSELASRQSEFIAGG